MNHLFTRPEPIPALYVKSLAGCHGPHWGVHKIFEKARAMAPYLLIFEDLESLISDKVKSFFLNEVDGLGRNDGIMMIWSIDYLERLDASIAKRPSRFDRKYRFGLPGPKERALYCDYWKSKLAKNQSIRFTGKLSEALAEITDGFSFAYLKEAFTSALLLIAAQRRNMPSETDEMEGEDPEDPRSSLLYQVFSKQVGLLRDELEERQKSVNQAASNVEKPVKSS